MSYVQDLRAVIGHRPLILVAAGVIILDSYQSVLLQRRTDDGLWSIPGGSMELGESAQDTARREVLGETGLVVGRLRLFDVFSGDELLHRYPNGDVAAIVSIVFLCDDVRGEVSISRDESVELRYFSAHDLKDLPLSPPNRPIIRRWLEHWPGTRIL